MTASLVVLYTFDYTGPKSVVPFMMLQASILSVQRTFGSLARIYVYTTTPDALTSLSAKVRVYSKYAFHHQLTSSYANKHFETIGHARIFLIPYLLQTEQLPILYLDNDTLLYSDKRDQWLHYIAAATHPIGYQVETWITMRLLVLGFTAVKEIPAQVDHWLEKPSINNGILLFPWTPASIAFADAVKDRYITLNTQMPCEFNDMFTFSIVWHDSSGSFVSTIAHEELCYHYYIEKHAGNHVLNNAIQLYLSDPQSESLTVEKFMKPRPQPMSTRIHSTIQSIPRPTRLGSHRKRHT